MDLYEQIHAQLEEGEEEEVVTLVQACLDEGRPCQEVLQKGLVDGMEIIGAKFRSGELFFPEVLLSATCMHAGLELVRPLLEESGELESHKLLIGTVADDVHDIGKNLVSMNFRAAGFEVVDIGVEVPSETFLEAIKEHEPDIVGISALLTTTMSHMRDTVQAIDDSGLRESTGLKIMVGGAPVTREFAEEIGADSYADDAIEGDSVARELVSA
jgi:5-methyltetrahydrofolate--homocysteine methyltransferase